MQKQDHTPSTPSSPSSQSGQRALPPLQPPVDIVENGSGITVLADLPGVEQKDLSIDIDGRTLTIDAPITLGEAHALISMYAEVRSNRYRRSFELSSELDTTAVSAELKDGVLSLRIPKAEHAKPRRVEVRAG